MTMQELVERLEKATGGDTTLNRDIYWLVVVGFEQIGPHVFENPITGARKLFRPGVSPRYTDSIDEALTLVPEGWAVDAMSQRSDGFWCVSLWRLGDWIAGSNGEAKALKNKSLPIAIVIASLRARLALASDGEKE